MIPLPPSDPLTLPAYIRHFSNEPTIQKALFVISVYDKPLYEALERGTSIDFFKVKPGYERDPEVRSTRGFTSGSTWLGTVGTPHISLNPEERDYPVHAAITLIHESKHAADMPKTVWGLYGRSLRGLTGLRDFGLWVFTGLTSQEDVAFGRASNFLENVLRIHVNEDVPYTTYFDEMFDDAFLSLITWIPIHLTWILFLMRRRVADTIDNLSTRSEWREEHFFRGLVAGAAFYVFNGIVLYCYIQLLLAIPHLYETLGGLILPFGFGLYIPIYLKMTSVADDFHGVVFAAFHRRQWLKGFENRRQAGVHLRKLWKENAEHREHAIWLHEFNNSVVRAGGDIDSIFQPDANDPTMLVRSSEFLWEGERDLIGKYYWDIDEAPAEARFFLGTHIIPRDDKWRLKLASDASIQIHEGRVAIQRRVAPDGTIHFNLWPESRLPQLFKEGRISREDLGNILKVELDDQHRFVFPSEWRDGALLAGDNSFVMAGSGTHFELWSQSAWSTLPKPVQALPTLPDDLEYKIYFTGPHLTRMDPKGRLKLSEPNCTKPFKARTKKVVAPHLHRSSPSKPSMAFLFSL